MVLNQAQSGWHWWQWALCGPVQGTNRALCTTIAVVAPVAPVLRPCGVRAVKRAELQLRNPMGPRTGKTVASDALAI